MAATKLTAADREFFAALAGVVFGNPFSAKRDELIVRLAPNAPLGDLTSDREALARVVGPRLAPWLRDNATVLRRLGAEDRGLLEPALLYVCYHRYIPQLDALIERQAAQSGTPLAVLFADEAIAELIRGGLPEERAVRYFAFYFQLRRAFYFIHHSLSGECESMQRLREALWNNIFTHDMRGYEAALWNRMEEQLRATIDLDPMIISNGREDGWVMPTHLTTLGFKILRVRSNLVEVRDILKQ